MGGSWGEGGGGDEPCDSAESDRGGGGRTAGLRMSQWIRLGLLLHSQPFHSQLLMRAHFVVLAVGNTFFIN